MAGIVRNRAVRAVTLWLVFGALTLAVVFPALQHLTWWGVHDWVQFYSYYGVPRRAVVDFHEIPGWNPYYYGGSIQWGNPYDPTLSPIFIPMVIFGEIVGSKIDVILSLLGGLFSMWLLARRLGVSPVAAMFASAVWALNGWHAFHLAVGHMDHLTFLFEPLAVYFFLRALDDRRWTFAAGATVAFMFLSGGSYPFVFTSLLIVVLSLFLCAQRNSGRPFKLAVMALSFAAGLAAVKLIPMLQFTALSPPVESDNTGTTLRMMYRGLFNSSLPLVVQYGRAKYGSWEYAAFIGYIPAALALVGAVAAAKKLWVWLGVGFIFLIAAFGENSPVNFFSLFTAPPGLSGMHVPFRFIIHSIMALAIAGAFGLDAIVELVGRFRLRAVGIALAAILAAASTANLVWMHYDRPFPLYSLISRYVPKQKYGGVLKPEDRRPAPTKEEKPYVPETFPHAIAVYETFLDNGRLSWGYDAVHLKASAKMPGDEGYQGEAYLADPGAGKASLTKSTLSTYTVAYETTAPTSVVLNQNYYPGWDADGASGDAVDRGGVVAAGVPAGKGEVTFAFRPATRAWGALVTALTMLGAFYFVRLRPGSLTQGERRPRGKKSRAPKVTA